MLFWNVFMLLDKVNIHLSKEYFVKCNVIVHLFGVFKACLLENI